MKIFHDFPRARDLSMICLRHLSPWDGQGEWPDVAAVLPHVCSKASTAQRKCPA